MATSCPRLQVPPTKSTRCATASPCAHNWKVPGQPHRSLSACSGRALISGRSPFCIARNSAAQSWAKLGLVQRRWRCRSIGRRTVKVCSGITVGATEEPVPRRSNLSSTSLIGSPEDPAALPGLEVLEDIFEPRRKGKPLAAELSAVAELESPPELHILEELLSEGGGVTGAAQGVAGLRGRGQSPEVTKVGSGDNVRDKDVGRIQAGGFGVNRQKWRRPPLKNEVASSNGEGTSGEQGGDSRSTLEAALRNASKSKEARLVLGGGGVPKKAFDPPSKKLTYAGRFGEDGRNEQIPNVGEGSEEARASRSPAKGESRQSRVVGQSVASTGIAQPAEKSVLRSRSADTQASRVPGAWAQWLNSVSERKGEEERSGVWDKLQSQTGNSEGVGDQQVLEGRETGEDSAVTGGVRPVVERYSGGAAGSGQEFNLSRGGDPEWDTGRGAKGVLGERGGKSFSRSDSEDVLGLGGQLAGVWSSNEDRGVSQAASAKSAAASVQTLGRNGVRFIAEGSQLTEEPALRRRGLAYEKLSPSELFGEEPFEAVTAKTGLRETGLGKGGQGERWGVEGLEKDFAEEDGALVKENDGGSGEGVELVQGWSRNAEGKGDDGELSRRGSSRNGAAGIPRNLEGAEIGHGRAWAVDTVLNPVGQSADGVESLRKSRLESGLGGGQPATRIWSASDRSGSASGLGSGFEGRPIALRRGRADAPERQGPFTETGTSREVSERVGDGREQREAERAAAKDRAWAAWQEFSSGRGGSPQEMSEFLAKWTAENAATGSGEEEEPVNEPRSAGGDMGRRRSAVSGWEGYVSDANGGAPEGSYSAFAERAAPRKVFVRGAAKGTPGGARREAISLSKGYGSDADGERREGSYSGFAKTAAPEKVFTRGAAPGTPGGLRSKSSGRGREVRPVAESLRSVEEADRPGLERPKEVRAEEGEFGGREDSSRGGGSDRALSHPRNGGVRTLKDIAPQGPTNGRQISGDPPIASEPSRETWVRRADASEGPGAEADVSTAFGADGEGADVSENRNGVPAAGAGEVSAESEEALEWGMNEGADPDWVGDDQLGADTWQEWEVEDDDDIVQPTETDWQKVFVAAAARRLQRAGREPETEPEPVELPAEVAAGGSPRVQFEELCEEEQKALLLRESLDLSVRNRVQKLKDSRPRKKPRDERTMEERGFAVFLEVLPELERQKLLCQKIKSGQLVWAPCCVYYVIHHSHTEILRFFNARTRALARQWKLGYSATKALNYYMRSSCALTLAIKNQLKSRAAAYRKWGRELTDPVTRAKFEMKTPIPLGGWDTIDWDRPVGVRAVGGGYYTPEEMRVRTRMVPQPITWKIPTVNDPTLGGKWDLGIETPQKVRQRTKPDGGRRGRR
ncbi:hypothetical protein KFL_002940040 [Klebsormidium nitens]|uniref:Domain X domain-containing protein n=1 Tax=Klebsormidium nitens TaxID=105231 RepID=A0A1Y1IEH8_KLENI|nr:hypothetical protein KFL_002940040 [Klebsormidium nitens]|eukprot:GAQ86518.1 hypothetical protein KFL_002940040 [Klebsormidium nitens]